MKTRREQLRNLRSVEVSMVLVNTIFDIEYYWLKIAKIIIDNEDYLDGDIRDRIIEDFAEWLDDLGTI